MECWLSGFDLLSAHKHFWMSSNCIQTAFPFLTFMNSVVPATFLKDCLLPLCPSILTSIQWGGPTLKEGLEEATETRREGKEKSRDPSQTGGCISSLLLWEDWQSGCSCPHCPVGSGCPTYRCLWSSMHHTPSEHILLRTICAYSPLPGTLLAPSSPSVCLLQVAEAEARAGEVRITAMA